MELRAVVDQSIAGLDQSLAIITALLRIAEIEHSRRLEAKPFKRYSTVLAATLAATLLIFLLGPAYLRHGASALLILTGDLVEASPYRIEVKPGNATRITTCSG